MNAEELEVVPGFEHENLQGTRLAAIHRRGTARGTGKGFRLSRGRHDYSQRRQLRWRDIFSTGVSARRCLSRVIRLFPKGEPKKVVDSVFRHREPGVYRARYGRGQKLGSLAEEVLGKEGGGRKEYRADAGKAGLNVAHNWRTRLVAACPSSDGNFNSQRQLRYIRPYSTAPRAAQMTAAETVKPRGPSYCRPLLLGDQGQHPAASAVQDSWPIVMCGW